MPKKKKRVLATLTLDDGLLMWETKPEVTDSAADIKEFQATLRQMATAMGEGWKRGKAREKAQAAAQK